MKLYHRTTEAAANAILSRGFKDATGYYMTGDEHTGVWLSNVPLDFNQGCKGKVLLVVELPEDRVTPFEWVEDEKPYREFLVPAAIANSVPVRLATDEKAT